MDVGGVTSQGFSVVRSRSLSAWFRSESSLEEGHCAPAREASAMSGTRSKPGELGPYVEGYREWLTQRGYTSQTVRQMLKDLGQVGQWMSREALVTSQLDEDAMAAFSTTSQANGRRRRLGPRAMVPLLTFLRELGVTPPGRPTSTPLTALLDEYRRWMVQERGLAPTTILRYENTARRFLQQQAVIEGVLQPAHLTGVDVNAFLLRECGRVSAGSAKGRVAELRSVLRFLYLQGLTPLRLGTAVPPVGGWRLAALPPPTIRVADVQKLLDSCDRDTVVGGRSAKPSSPTWLGNARPLRPVNCS